MSRKKEPDPGTEYGQRATRLLEYGAERKVKIPRRTLVKIRAAERVADEAGANPAVKRVSDALRAASQSGTRSDEVFAASNPNDVSAYQKWCRLNENVNRLDHSARTWICGIETWREERARRNELTRSLLTRVFHAIITTVSRPRAGRGHRSAQRLVVASAGGGDDSSGSPDPDDPAARLGVLHLDNLKPLIVAVIICAVGAIACGVALGALLAAVVPK